MSDMAATWPDRRVSTGYETAEELARCYNRENWRAHPEAQRLATEDSLDSLGLIGQIKKNTSGLMFDGHLRVELALLKNPSMLLPVDYYDLNDDETALALAIHDAITEQAEPIPDKLAALLERTRALTAERPGLGAMLAALKERAGINGHQVTEDEPPKVDKAAELQKVWGTELGQIWQLGNHRLAVGDCTDRATVEAVMRGERAEMMFTDPPYGVDYTGGHFHSGDVNIKRERPRLANDNDTGVYARFLPIVLPFVDGPCYVWFASSVGKPVYDAITENDCEIHAMIVWHKINATYAAVNAQYKQRHEPCLYFKPKGSTLRWVGPTDECTLWEIKRDAVNEYHPTQKPIELAMRAIGNHSAKIVIDCFIGSGSTIIAGENLGRKVRACEIDPGYAAVSIQRWVDLTGIEPHRLT